MERWKDAARLWLGSCLLGTAFLTTFAAPSSAQLDADFTGSPVSGNNPLTVSFTDMTTGAAPGIWLWDFGDGSTSTLQNPTHTYSLPGTHSVSLTASVGPQSEQHQKSGYIMVSPSPLVVAFGAQPMEGPTPLLVNFRDDSVGSTVTEWLWDFGDGTISRDQHPSHVYTASKTTSFSVSLTAFIGQQSGTLDKPDLIDVVVTFGPPQQMTFDVQIQAIQTADLDGDGDPDVLVASQGRGDVLGDLRWLRNDIPGGFGSVKIAMFLNGYPYFSVDAADLDGDGDLDVVSTGFSLDWYENSDGLGTFSPAHLIDGIAGTSVRVADLDGDTDNDVLLSSGHWYENIDGQGSFGPAQLFTTTGGGPMLVTDVDGDGDIDVVFGGNGKIGWNENLDGRATFGPLQIITASLNSPSGLHAADVDGDGDPDVLSGSNVDDKLVWYENTDGLGSFGSEQVITTVTDSPRSVYAADLDGDGDADVLSASFSDNTVAWYENTDGLGSFGPQQVIPTGTLGDHLVRAADFDGDGDTDVLSSNFDLTTFFFSGDVQWYANTLVLAPWKFLGGGTPGVNSQPVLTAVGPLTAGSLLEIKLEQAPAHAFTLLRVSQTSQPLSVVGGTFYANPYDLQLLLVVDHAGEWSLDAPVALDVPSGVDVYFQCIVQDETSIFGATLSNAVMATMP
jgi:PKD repeat protein